jgi:hypothetical protein
MSSDLEVVLALLPQRYEMAGDVLSQHIQDNFSGSLLSLSDLKPFIEEMLRRFKHLPRTQNVDGTHPNIAGFRTFGYTPKCQKCHKPKHDSTNHEFEAVIEKCTKCHQPEHEFTTHKFELDLEATKRLGWCKGTLNRDSRTVRYMLAGGNLKRSGGGREIVSTLLDADAILQYLDNAISQLDTSQRKLVLQGLTRFVSRLGNNPKGESK